VLGDVVVGGVLVDAGVLVDVGVVVGATVVAVAGAVVVVGAPWDALLPPPQPAARIPADSNAAGQ
jgi:hypothetical protein